MEKIKKLYIQYKEIINYLICGVLTTFVNWIVFWACYYPLHIANVPSNVIAWIAAVIFAFVVNKILVFESRSWEMRFAAAEFIKFVGCRVASGVFEIIFMFFTVDAMHADAMLMKILCSVVVMILNYVGSKLFVFKK